VVQAAAAVSRPSTGLIAELFGDEVGSDGIRAAVDAGVLAVDGERIAFTHPVLATAAYAQLSDHDRRQLHSRLATLLDDVEERARHLAMATAHPDADVAGALDSAARRARARCAPDAAAELWDAAARLSPSDQADAARGRRLEAAQCWFEAGEVERARAMFEDILRGAPPGRVRARTLARLSWAVAHIDGFEAGSQAFRAALVELGDDVAAEIEVQQGLVWCLHSASGVASAEPHAQRALVLAERSGDPRLIGGAVTHVAFLRSLAGHGLAVDDVARAVERAAAGAEVSERSPILGRPEWIHGMLLEWQDRLGEAHDCFRRLHRQAIDIGDEQSLPFILFQMARTELLMGDWTQARRSAEVCAETTHNSGQASERPYACAITALVDAHLGSVDAARAGIAEGLALSRRFGVRPAALEMLATQGFLDLSLGRYEAADRALTEVAARAEESGLREPALFRYHGDAIEAKVALGRLDEAAALLAGARELAERLARPWMEMVVARGSGLLEAAGGGLDSAGELLTSSLGDDRVGQPFERARTLLVLGSVQRRNRKKRPARDALCAAADIFRGLGAQLWVDRAEAESARIGGRPPVAGLTPTELRVAELIAAGRTYREAGAELFISPKTVQWNLSKVYSKLGIRSRAELPGRLQGG
jgi:DNA-binding CsgD family transcriptional regulator